MQGTEESGPVPAALTSGLRRTIVLFWDDLDRLPGDVSECTDSWRHLKARGFDIRLFDNAGARKFIARCLGPRYENAYRKCYHPAMQSDYFRLCYILVKGGCYVDADDVHNGPEVEHLFDDGRLKLQPLCYDIETDRMIPPEVFTERGADAPTWIFYFNNNPLLAAPGHPIVDRALANATAALEQTADGEFPEIQDPYLSELARCTLQPGRIPQRLRQQRQRQLAGIGVEAWGWFLAAADNTQLMKNEVQEVNVGISLRAVAWDDFTTLPPSVSNGKVVQNVLDGDGVDGTGIVISEADESDDFDPTASNNKIVNNEISGFSTSIDEDGTDTKVSANGGPASP